MGAFEHLSPEYRFFYGSDSLGRLPREVQRAGASRALVIASPSVAASGGVKLVTEVLGALCAGVFTEVREHSPVPTVIAAARAMKAVQADAVVAVGGGSAIVTARAASIVLAEGEDVRALCTRKGADGRMVSPRLDAPKAPQFIVPTTPTTALVKAGSAVRDPDNGQRLALFDPKTRSRAVFIHPQMLLSAPASLSRSASLNTLAMVVEGLESATGSAMSDATLMHALRLLATQLPALERHPEDAEVRGQLVLASILCGQGTDHAGSGLASVLGHAIGPHCGVANGVVNAIVLPHTMRFNAGATGQRLSRVLDALGSGASAAPQDTAQAATTAIEAVLAQLALPRRLRDAGVKREDFAHIAGEALDDWFIQRNPRRVQGEAELLALLDAAW